MQLREIAPADAEFDARRAEVPVGGVTADSRIVKRGDVFVAIAGGKADGMRFIDPAIAAGATITVHSQHDEYRSTPFSSTSGKVLAIPRRIEHDIFGTSSADAGLPTVYSKTGWAASTSA